MSDIDFELIKRLNDEKRALLEARPELASLQAEIDRELAKAGSQANRCAVMNRLMKQSFNQMTTQLVGLGDKLKELVRIFNGDSNDKGDL
jgi:hypothetical protein